MAMGQVRGEFFYAQTRPTGLLLWPEPSPFNKQVFFHSKPTPLGPVGPVPLCLAQKSETQILIYDFPAQNHKHKHKSKHKHKHKHINHKHKF